MLLLGIRLFGDLAGHLVAETLSPQRRAQVQSGQGVQIPEATQRGQIGTLMPVDKTVKPHTCFLHTLLW